MKEDRRKNQGPESLEISDTPLVRYRGEDAIVRLGSGDATDLNAVPDPFTGDLPAATGLTHLQTPGEDPDAEERQRIGRRLRALREDQKLSKKDVAARAGIAVTRLTEIEKGEAALGVSLVSSLVSAMDANLWEIAHPNAPEISAEQLVRVGARAGVPRPALERIREVVGRQRFSAGLQRAFHWSSEALASGAPRSPRFGLSVAFNARRDRRPRDDSPVLALARTMSELAASAHDSSFKSIPADPAALRQEVLAASSAKVGTHARVTLDALLTWAWEAGVIVLPLPKARDFGAAVWFVGDVPVIVLQENRSIGAYWLFVLAHELGHLALGHVAQGGIVDLEPLRERASTGDEHAANEFALELVLPNARTLLAEVRSRTANDAPRRFKFAVASVAREHSVSVGVLGFAAAREMADVPSENDRWGSASNLALEEDPNGRARVEAAFSARIRGRGLDALDSALLQALTSSS